ncbi:peptidylprolyl isomerase [Polyangium sp. 6x1]|uniref:peptidylprolyl isomerase n=1 Tax=Polyangium sp. 6x1 TaxID=3042689 RepID=UPI002482F3F8|nr:peptidylprolyl isomerase [Polyangium sp. 6x1]MDI1451819.1 peptidylprolyl isomerase [Polyangium sp. 6x1]
MQFPAINVPGQGQLHARLVTTLGDIVLRLEEEKAPNTVKNFVALATGAIAWRDPKTKQSQKSPLFNGVRFHRVIPNFMIQCGDPLTHHPDMAAAWGRGGPGYEFEDEFHPDLRHDGPGVLSMANSGPGTNGSQWFITEKATPHLNNRHSVFGKVVSGQDVVNKIANAPRGPADRPMQDVVLERVEIFRQ